MELVINFIGYAFITLTLVGLAYFVVRVFCKLTDDDDDD